MVLAALYDRLDVLLPPPERRGSGTPSSNKSRPKRIEKWSQAFGGDQLKILGFGAATGEVSAGWPRGDVLWGVECYAGEDRTGSGAHQAGAFALPGSVSQEDDDLHAESGRRQRKQQERVADDNECAEAQSEALATQASSWRRRQRPGRRGPSDTSSGNGRRGLRCRSASASR